MHSDDRRVPLLRRLAQDLRPVRGRLAIAAIAIVALGAAQLYLTWLVKRVLDGPLVTGDRAALTPILAEALATLAIAAVALAAARCLVASANLHLVDHLRRQAATRLLHMPLSVARRYATGDVLARVLTDATVLTTFLGSVVRRAVREMVVAGGAMALLFVLNWRLALAGLLVVPPCAWLIDRFGRRLRRAGARTQDDLGRLGALLSEQLAGLSTIKGFGAESHEADRFTTASGHVRAQALAAERIGAALTGIVFLFTGVALVAVVGWGTLLLASGEIDRTGFFLFGLYAAQTIEPMRRLSELQGQLQPALASAARLYEIIDQREIESRDGLPLPDRVARQLSFDRVTFRFPDGADVLQGLTLHLRPGDQVALVGPSGAGKSTMAALVRRFLAAGGGEIRVDDMPIDQLAVGDLRRAAIVVEQDTFLFSGSIEDNIRLGRTDVTPAAVEEAVRLAGLTAVCAALPQGLATPAHEAGRRLSGGEKQRVALARAVLHDPGLLILDEATSALDGDTEAAVFATLDPWLRRRTVVAISHRWATVARFPRLVALANGRIVVDGPTDRVAHTTPLVRELFADQWSAPTV